MEEGAEGDADESLVVEGAYAETEQVDAGLVELQQRVGELYQQEGGDE